MARLNENFATCRTIKLRQVAGSLFSYAINITSRAHGGVHIVVADDRDAAAYLCQDLCRLTPAGALFFPTAYKRSIQSQREDSAGIVQRTAALGALGRYDNPAVPLVICTYPEALTEKVAQPKRLSQNTIHVQRGEKLDIAYLEEILLEYKFERVDFVGEPGQYSIRGGIIDIFSFSDNRPYRLDLFGDMVDSIRLFNISTQLSVESCESVDIVPNLKNETLAQERVSLAEYIAQTADARTDTTATLWMTNPTAALARIDAVRTKLLGELAEPSTIDNLATSRRAMIADSEPFRWVVLMSTIPERAEDYEIDFESSPQPQFNKNFELLASDIRTGNATGRTTYLLTENHAQSERLENIFNSLSSSVKSLTTQGVDHAPTGYGHVPLTLHAGFVWPAIGVALYTDHQIFDRYHRYSTPGEIDRRESLTIAELNSLQVGDYVVHIDHGVGRFGGLVRSHEGGATREFIKLTYQGGDVLFVSVHSLHRISKYKDKDAPEPKVHKLGSGAWQKLKATTKSKIKDIARELIALYAKRKASQGFAYSPDSYLQQELEASFLYEDTPDQQSTTRAIKEDMESAEPMDRLVCGDVGFGKTEIAIRAAFKAVTDGKQVAVLVPTTVLSLQHYRTFTRRLKEFPVRVENFSRVKSTKQAGEILDQLRRGEVDILIGTHRLLGKNVEFKDLGLLVIDEEQKFGVANKVKLRHLKANVDTLTLTATPIPRTLQFSLMGARDMSIINTPPPNRQPVATEVAVYNDELIAEAITAEVERGGQVFFLHNRVQSIEKMAATIRRLCPGVRTIIGHGQMAATELEKVMMEFIYGEADVLLATTIIESGIDIPNANTIIINNAHMFGLSDLHQLRGRVGRTNRKAYCYLLIPSEEAVTGDAHRRLRAIEEFSDLGSGFNIAMQDLDIRGAGNILGAEQSGFIADIGYETYQKIMAEAVAELREEQGLEPLPGEAVADDCTIESNSAAHLPDSYIGQAAEKLRLYRELDSITTAAALDEFITRLTDRFGPPPEVALELLDIVRLRQLAVTGGIEKIVLRDGGAVLHMLSNQNSPFYKSERFMTILRGVSADPKRYALQQSGTRLTIAVAQVRTIAGLLKLLQKLLP